MIHNILYTAVKPRESDMGLQAECTCLRFRAQVFGPVATSTDDPTADRLFRLMNTAEQHRTNAIAAEVRESLLRQAGMSAAS